MSDAEKPAPICGRCGNPLSWGDFGDGGEWHCGKRAEKPRSYDVNFVAPTPPLNVAAIDAAISVAMSADENQPACKKCGNIHGLNAMSALCDAAKKANFDPSNQEDVAGRQGQTRANTRPAGTTSLPAEAAIKPGPALDLDALEREPHRASDRDVLALIARVRKSEAEPDVLRAEREPRMSNTTVYRAHDWQICLFVIVLLSPEIAIIFMALASNHYGALR